MQFQHPVIMEIINQGLKLNIKLLDILLMKSNELVCNMCKNSLGTKFGGTGT